MCCSCTAFVQHLVGPQTKKPCCCFCCCCSSCLARWSTVVSVSCVLLLLCHFLELQSQVLATEAHAIFHATGAAAGGGWRPDQKCRDAAALRGVHLFCNAITLLARSLPYVVVAVWLGLPCNTWGKARRGKPWNDRCDDRKGFPAAIRDANHLWGFSHAVLSPKDVKILKTHNILTRFALAVITTCVTRSIPVAVENPQASLFWKLPEVEDLVSEQAPVLHKIITDLCCWGTPWRKCTCIYFWHWPSTVLTLGRRCHSRRGAKGAPACRG